MELSYKGRELYLAAPVALVAAEVRFGHEPLLASDAGIQAVLERLRADFPLLQREDVETLSLTPGGSTTAQQVQWRALSESRMVSVTVSAHAVVLEATDYQDGYDAFRKPLEQMCLALAEPLAKGRIWRLGLRYIDEIRLPGLVKSAADWREWLAPQLTSSLGLAGSASVAGFHGDVAWETSAERMVTMRWGSFDQGTVLAPTLPLQRPRVPSSDPIFVLDIDSSWQPGTPPAYSSDLVLDGFDQLHFPTGQAFQGCLTDKLRKEFRQEGDSGDS